MALPGEGTSAGTSAPSRPQPTSSPPRGLAFCCPWDPPCVPPLACLHPRVVPLAPHCPPQEPPPLPYSAPDVAAAALPRARRRRCCHRRWGRRTRPAGGTRRRRAGGGGGAAPRSPHLFPPSNRSRAPAVRSSMPEIEVAAAGAHGRARWGRGGPAGEQRRSASSRCPRSAPPQTSAGGVEELEPEEKKSPSSAACAPP
ncbi:unnamed protein product [Urochloa humidicola]